MGYDMSIRGKVPAAPQHDIDQAKAGYDAAQKVFEGRRAAGEFAGNPDALFEALREPDRLWAKWYRLKNPENFSLNMYGMGAYADAMLDLGMAHESTNPVTSAGWESLPEDYETDEEEAAYYEASDKLTGQHGDSDNPTIPLHKFGSNDGWYVTPGEIRAALDAWENFEAGTPDGFSPKTLELVQTELWGEWIAYLELAAEHDGFRVY